MKNKRGWIRIVEAFVSILLIAGVLLTIIGSNSSESDDLSEQVYSFEISVLREIQLDEELRDDILTSNNSEFDANIDENENNRPLPINWSDFGNGDVGLETLKNRINDRIPNYLECSARICSLDRICALDDYPEKNVYSRAVAITATDENYDPRQLKLFCWTVE